MIVIPAPQFHPAVGALLALIPDTFPVLAVGDFARDIIFNCKPETISLVLLGADNSISDAFPAEANRIREGDTLKVAWSSDGFDFRIEYYAAGYVTGADLMADITAFSTQYNAGKVLSTDKLTLLLNTRYRNTLIDTENVYPELIERTLTVKGNIAALFQAQPLLMPEIVYQCGKYHFVITDELSGFIKEYANNLADCGRPELTNYLIRTLALPEPGDTLIMYFHLGLLNFMFPEAVRLAGVEQMKEYNHKDVFFHTCAVINNIAPATENVWLRFAALVHDIAKPRTKRFVEGTGWTFHGHEEIGARMMKGIFRRLELPMSQLDYVEKLVRLHLRPAALVDEGVSDSAIRRLITESGPDLEDLLTLCRADITSKNPSKVSKVLRNYEHVATRIIEVREKDALAAFQSPVRGEEIMKICNIPPSKTVGLIKTAIEEAILNNEIENTYEAAYEYMLKIKDSYLGG